MRTVKGMVVLLLIAAIPAGLSAAWHARGPEGLGAMLRAGDAVLLVDVRAWPERVLWLDARSRERFGAGHVPGAMLLSEDEWEELLWEVAEAWRPEWRVVVYCDDRGCGASRAVAERLRDEMAWENVYVLEGGWQAWQAAQR